MDKPIREAVELLRAFQSQFGARRPDEDEDDAETWDRIDAVCKSLTAAQQQGQAVVWVSAADIAPFVGAPQMAEFWGTVTLASGPGDGRTVPLYLTAAQQQGDNEVNMGVTVRDGAWVGTYDEWCRHKQDAPPSAPVGAAEDMVLDAIERRESSAPVGVEAILEAFDEISGLCRHLRQGGPVPDDLQDLSDALGEAVGIATNMLHALTQQPAAPTWIGIDWAAGQKPAAGAVEAKTVPVPTRVRLIGETAVIVGTPGRGWDEEGPEAHNCDAMGCATIGPHVLARVPFTDERALSTPAEARGVVDGAVGTVTRVGSFEVQEHRIELDPEFDERLNYMPEGTVVRLYAAPVRDLTQQQLADAAAALAGQHQEPTT